jgi:hypothetical protein
MIRDGAMRLCDNCGKYSEGAFCQACGKPFPPPLSNEPQHDQVEFRSPVEPQRPVREEPSPAQSSQYTYRTDSSGSYQYRTETYRYRGSTNVHLGRQEDASTAWALGVVALIFAFLFSPLGLIFGILAVHLGRKGQREGLARADAAVTTGYISIVISVLMMIILLGLLIGLRSVS